MAAVVPNQTVVTGSNATLATAVSTYRTNLAAAITAAQAVVGVNADQVQVSNAGIIYDGTVYVVYGSVNYKVG